MRQNSYLHDYRQKLLLCCNKLHYFGWLYNAAYSKKFSDTSFKNLKNELLELLFKDNYDKINEIKIKILSYDYVEGIHNLILHTYGNNNAYMTIHAEIDDKIDFSKIYRIIEKIENDIQKQFSINLTIHIDPISKLN